MNKFVIIISGVVVALGVIIGSIFFSNQAAAPESEKIAALKITDTTMTITSPSFQHNSFIPKQFTCDGENINPELRIRSVSENAKSLALIMDDPDATIGNFTHWLLWNIDPNISLIAEHSVPDMAVQGKNGAGKSGYIGPCPPSGTHRYFFKLYALDTKLDLLDGSTKDLLESEIDAHLLEKAELIGLYQR